MTKQQQKLIGVLTIEETEIERATRLLVFTWSYSGDFFKYESYFVTYFEGYDVAARQTYNFPSMTRGIGKILDLARIFLVSVCASGR